MASQVDGYSRLVKITKVILPIVALAMLASIFVLSNNKAIREGLIFTDVEMAELAIGQKVTNPHFSGVTRAGDAFSISAEWALPDAPAPERIDLNLPSTVIDFRDGRTLKARSATGSLNLKTNEAVLQSGVRLATSDGYSAKSERLMMNFRTGNIFSPGPVSATGPVGSIEAGSMQARQDLDQNPNGDKSVLLFQNGVKLIYIPRQK
jgi:lipopolysaccharide export system protein LptC